MRVGARHSLDRAEPVFGDDLLAQLVLQDASFS